MLRFFRLWREKRQLKKEFAQGLRELVVLNWWDELEDDYDVELRKLESAYLKRGLTQPDLDRIRENLGPVRVE